MTATRPAARRFVVDADRCRRCGRGAEGLQCAQPVTLGYEHQLARTRAAQRWHGRAPAWGAAPCSRACPLALCVQGYAKHLAAGELAESLGHILSRTTLPETVCRVCDRPCERACVRSDLEGPVAINDLKRHVVDWAVAEGRFPEPVRAPSTGRTVGVVGAGPAGLTVAQRAALAGHAVTLYDAADRAGGIPALHIPRYRLPPAAIEGDVARVLALGVTFVPNTVLGRDVSVDALLDRHDAVVLALGAGRPRTLDLPGRGEPSAPAVLDALALLRAARDDQAPPLPGAVVVVGGGDAAVDVARSALRLGASTVTVACLERRDAMPALPDQIAAAVAEGIDVRDGIVPRRLGQGEAIFGPATGEDEPETRLPADAVVLAIGQVPDDSFVEAGAPALARGSSGRWAVDELTGRTSHPRLYLAGDMAPGGGTVSRAIASGLRVAAAVQAVLERSSAGLTEPPPPPPARSVPRHGPAPTAPMRTGRAERRHPPELRARARSMGFDEVMGTLSRDAARAEAERCLVCGTCANCLACIDLFGCPALVLDGGRVTIEPSLCNGCGVCAELCPNGAIVPEARP